MFIVECMVTVHVVLLYLMIYGSIGSDFYDFLLCGRIT